MSNDDGNLSMYVGTLHATIMKAKQNKKPESVTFTDESGSIHFVVKVRPESSVVDNIILQAVILENDTGTPIGIDGAESDAIHKAVNSLGRIFPSIRIIAVPNENASTYHFRFEMYGYFTIPEKDYCDTALYHALLRYLYDTEALWDIILYLDRSGDIDLDTLLQYYTAA